MDQSINQSIKHSVGQSFSQPTNHTVNQTINQSSNQAIKQSKQTYKYMCQYLYIYLYLYLHIYISPQGLDLSSCRLTTLHHPLVYKGKSGYRMEAGYWANQVDGKYSPSSILITINIFYLSYSILIYSILSTLFHVILFYLFYSILCIYINRYTSILPRLLC